MKILVFGAGVIGCIYASKLYEKGYNIKLLARGKNYERLKQNGVILKDVLSGKQTTCKVPIIENLNAEDFYDLIIVTVRLDQVNEVIPVLKRNPISPLIMMMLNIPEGIGQIESELNPKRLILGFPGVGGNYKDARIEYIQIKQQQTTIGEINGKTSQEIKNTKDVFERGGFKTEISKDIEGWLKIHSVFISCASAAIIKENGSSVQLGKKRSSVKVMVKSIRQGFKACKNLGISIIPLNLKIIFLIMPTWFSILYWQKAMQGKVGTLAIAPHANYAKDEMKLIAKNVLTFVRSSSIPTPTLDQLLSSFINNE